MGIRVTRLSCNCRVLSSRVHIHSVKLGVALRVAKEEVRAPRHGFVGRLLLGSARKLWGRGASCLGAVFHEHVPVARLYFLEIILQGNMGQIGEPVGRENRLQAEQSEGGPGVGCMPERGHTVPATGLP